MTFYLFPILIFFATYIFIGLFLKFNILKINDEPNKRSLHKIITPRYGGIIFITFPLAISFFIFPDHIKNLIYLSSFILFISFIDDIKNLNIIFRLLVHFIISFLLVFIQPGIYNIFLFLVLIFYLVWSINLSNFIDGANGLAGGTSFVTFLAYATAFYLSGNNDFFLFSLIIASSILAFLFYNFNKAKIFMGDSGAASLGFLTGSFGFYGWTQDYWHFWFPLVVSAPVIADTTITLVKRVLNKEKFWQPHQSHFFQKLIIMGHSHKIISVIYMHLTFIFSSTALIANYFAIPVLSGILLLPLGIILIISIFMIERRWVIFDKKANNFLRRFSFNDLSLRYHKILVIFFDMLLIILSWYLAYAIRFSFDLSHERLYSLYDGLLAIIFFQSFSFYLFNIHKSSWRYVSVSDFLNIIYSIAISSLFILIFFLVTTKFYLPNLFNFNNVPRSIFLIDFILITSFICGSRLFFRAFYENFTQPLADKNIAIVGISDESISISKQLFNNKQWNLIGFIEDGTYKDRKIHGLKVLGGVNNIKEIHNLFNINNIIISNRGIGNTQARDIYRICHTLNIQVLSIPLLNDILSEKINFSNTKKIDIEDLLGRDKFDSNSQNLPTLFDSNTVLITGAGGTIGSELVNQAYRLNPKLIICFDISEVSLYELQQSNFFSDKSKIIFIVGDIKDEIRVSSILKKYKPNIIIHAAAYKHVPMMEENNIYEAFMNNSYGTYLLSKQAKKNNVDKFIFISTDKAINPTNIMGSSKRLAEIYCQSFNQKNSTKFITVRFGNVLGSSGSAIPLFKKQIEKGGPITITHPDITRYFMSQSEAVRLVLEAANFGNGGEIFVLDMGVPIKINDLVKDMIALYGLNEDSIKIKYIGLRPGEKLFEELLADDELTLPTLNKKIRVAKMPNSINLNISDSLLWIKKIHLLSESKIKKDLKLLIKEYNPKK